MSRAIMVARVRPDTVEAGMAVLLEVAAAAVLTRGRAWPVSRQYHGWGLAAAADSGVGEAAELGVSGLETAGGVAAAGLAATAGLSPTLSRRDLPRLRVRKDQEVAGRRSSSGPEEVEEAPAVSRRGRTPRSPEVVLPTAPGPPPISATECRCLDMSRASTSAFLSS